MRGSLHKRYQPELAESGVWLPPMLLVEPSEDAISAALDELAVDEAAVKLRVSGGAIGLNRVRRGDP
jgi:hypothetical protein